MVRAKGRNWVGVKHLPGKRGVKYLILQLQEMIPPKYMSISLMFGRWFFAYSEADYCQTRDSEDSRYVLFSRWVFQ